MAKECPFTLTEALNKKHKKVVLRFLKEVGFYCLFKRYIKENDIKNWHKCIYIDSILGRLNFTDFIRDEAGIELPASIASLFRTYLVQAGMDKEFIIKCSSYINHDAVSIKDFPGRIHINYATKEQDAIF